MSKTTQGVPARSTKPPVCFSFEALEKGRLSRSSRNRVRSASTGTCVNATKKRESAEREGSRSRRNLRHERNRKGLELLVELLQGAFSADGRARSGRQESRSPRRA